MGTASERSVPSGLGIEKPNRRLWAVAAGLNIRCKPLQSGRVLQPIVGGKAIDSGKAGALGDLAEAARRFAGSIARSRKLSAGRAQGRLDGSRSLDQPIRPKPQLPRLPIPTSSAAAISFPHVSPIPSGAQMQTLPWRPPGRSESPAGLAAFAGGAALGGELYLQEASFSQRPGTG